MCKQNPKTDSKIKLIMSIKFLRVGVSATRQGWFEVPIGFKQIICQRELVITLEMDAADYALYEAKKKRRKSIQK